MHYGLEVVTLGEFGDPRVVTRLALAAETAGWDGLFVWDHLAYVWGVPAGDPWIILAAAAQVTRRLRLGTMVTPLPRRRLQVLAQTLVTLDQLSQGRLIFGAGLGGVPEEFSAFGEDTDARRRARQLDLGLAILARWWAGETVSHRGEALHIDGVALLPRPVQRPRIPIWIGGESRAARRRAARWDGWVIPGTDEHGRMTRRPEELARQLSEIRARRPGGRPLDVAMTGISDGGDRERPQAFAAVGLTWWLESIHGYRGDVATMEARVRAGPPR